METLEKQELFWDVNIGQIDTNVHKKFIVKRILHFGDLDDLNWALKLYGNDSMREIFLSSMDQLDKKSLNFWLMFFDEMDQNECIKKQLTNRQNAFWAK